MSTEAAPTPLRVLALIYPGCTIAETIGLTTRLADQGCDVTYISAGDSIDVVDQSGLRLVADQRITDVELGGIAAVIVPGGDPGSIIDEVAVRQALSELADRGTLVAGICAGVLVMASAGVLDGRRATHNYRAPWAPPQVEAFVERFWADVDVEPDPVVGVVVDGSLVTALPGAAIEFAMTVCVELAVLERDQAESIARHLRGESVFAESSFSPEPGAENGT